MFSKNLKRKIAVLLTGVMVLGMTVTASAETGTSSDYSGAGTNEGHVSRNVVSVTLPSVKEGTTPFNYTLDPEGLIQETEAAAYGWDKIDATASANRVYFQHDDNKYYGTSNSYTLSNNSAVSVNFVVEVKATKGAKDATLVANEAAVTDGGDDVLLYLGLDAGDKGKKAIESEKTVSVEFTLGGTPENYEVVCKNPTASAPHTYAFEKKATPVKDWPSVSFNLIGKCNKVSDADGVTAPTLTVTWKYQDSASAAEPSTPAVVAPSTTKTAFNKTENGSGVDVVFDPGSYEDGIVAVKWSATNSDDAEWQSYGVPENYYTIDDNTLTVLPKIFTSSGTRYWRVYFADDAYVTLTFSMN